MAGYWALGWRLEVEGVRSRPVPVRCFRVAEFARIQPISLLADSGRQRPAPAIRVYVRALPSGSNLKARKLVGGRTGCNVRSRDITVHLGRQVAYELVQRLRRTLDHQPHAAVGEVTHITTHRVPRGDGARRVPKAHPLHASGKVDVAAFGSLAHGKVRLLNQARRAPARGRPARGSWFGPSASSARGPVQGSSIAKPTRRATHVGMRSGGRIDLPSLRIRQNGAATWPCSAEQNSTTGRNLHVASARRRTGLRGSLDGLRRPA